MTGCIRVKNSDIITLVTIMMMMIIMIIIIIIIIKIIILKSLGRTQGNLRT